MYKNNNKKLTICKSGGGYLNTKGFTLVEMIAVVVIIALISLIMLPLVINQVNNSKGKLDDTMNKVINESAISYIETNGEYTTNYGSVNCIKIKDLIDYGYLDEPLINPSTKKKIDQNLFVKVTSETPIDHKFELTDTCEAVVGIDKFYTINEVLQKLPTKKVNINGEVVNKVYGDKDARTSMKNYVWFSGNLWQILEVNDNDIKLVTSMPITSIAYGNNSDYNSSWVKKWLEQKFYPTLENKDLIVSDNFCLDSPVTTTTDVVQDSTYTIKKVSNHTKINSCSNNINTNIGLLTFEDYVYASNGVAPVYDKANFISGEEIEWTMSKYDNDQMWITWYNSSFEYITATQNLFSFTNRYGHGVRPVISIKGSTLVSSGTGSNKNPYVLSNEKMLNENSNIENVKIGDYVYLDESKNPNSFTSERTTRDVTYTTTKDKVRYRVIDKNANSVKVQRADILRGLNSDVSISSAVYVPYYYSSTCGYINGSWIYSGCTNHNYFQPTQGTGDYNYKESENIGYFLNNASNSFYSWYSDKTKTMITDTTFNLVTSGYGKDYSNLDNGTPGATYPSRTNDGNVIAKVGLPSWGDMYSGNDLNYRYWYINRWEGSASSASYVGSHGSGISPYAGSYRLAVRPVVSLKNTVKIKNGKGTMTEPYSLK